MTLPDVIVIRGAPGSGKSETARRIASRLGQGARVEVDTLRAMIIPVKWTDQQEHIAILSLTVNVVIGLLQLGHRPVIVVDTFSGDKLDRFLADLLAARAGTVVRTFSLAPDWPVLKARVERRPPDGFKDLHVCKKLNADVRRRLLPGELLIDNSALTAEAAADAVLQACAVC